jgi:septal ring factor EnvC (AmiA/AmiB activator)
MADPKPETDEAAAKLAADAEADAKQVSDKAAAAKKAAAESKSMLAKIKHVVLTSVYGFYDEAGKYVGWVEGHIVTEAEHIKLLIERKAPVTVVEHEEAPK